jgi:hypothetical protein
VLYSYANAVPGGWVGVVCADAALTKVLYESATVCVSEDAAEEQASDEFRDAVKLVEVGGGEAGAA